MLRDALFLSEFGALALPYAYIGVAVAAGVFVWLESLVARRFTRVGATRFNQYAAIAFSLVAAGVLPYARHWTIVGFYLWTGSQAMMLLPHFWALALDVWDSRRARSVFPLLAGCGLIGGLLGGAFAAWSTPVLKQAGLMWTLSGLLVLAYALTRVVERHRARRQSPLEVSSTTSRWEIVLRSRYIKVLAAALALSVVVSTLVDFQFKLFIQHVYPDPHALTQFFREVLRRIECAVVAVPIQRGGVAAAPPRSRTGHRPAAGHGAAVHGMDHRQSDLVGDRRDAMAPGRRLPDARKVVGRDLLHGDSPARPAPHQARHRYARRALVGRRRRSAVDRRAAHHAACGPAWWPW